MPARPSVRATPAAAVGAFFPVAASSPTAGVGAVPDDGAGDGAGLAGAETVAPATVGLPAAAVCVPNGQTPLRTFTPYRPLNPSEYQISLRSGTNAGALMAYDAGKPLLWTLGKVAYASSLGCSGSRMSNKRMPDAMKLQATTPGLTRWGTAQ